MISLLHSLLWCDKARVYKAVSQSSDELTDVSGYLSALAPLDRFWISPRSLTADERRDVSRLNVHVGLVQVVFFPSTYHDVLTLTNFASRSDDGGQQFHHHPLLEKLKRRLMPHLARPVIVRGGAGERAYMDIGYSAGAASWWLGGKKWGNPMARAQELLMPDGGAVPSPIEDLSSST